jgi:hypothetical protein
MFKDLAKSKQPGKKIADWLGDARTHKTHGRPTNIEKAKNIGLRVEALENDQDLQEKVLSVFHATMVTFAVTPCVKMVENHNGTGRFVRVDLQPALKLKQ